MKKILILLSCFLLVSCNNNQIDKVEFIDREINQEEVFNQEENKYLVLFYSPTCPACKDVIKILNEKYDQKPFAIYLLNLHNSEITRTKEVVSNIDVNNINDVKIYSTPTLFFIENKVIKLEARGLEKIREENYFISFL